MEDDEGMQMEEECMKMEEEGADVCLSRPFVVVNP